ncbi:hypothetical protein EZV73_23365 [Acidaminobacter sp. JC074]|uniref:hypothetical protein n=1 Tax=Acidaminobacter sp. JC074 TaxID=2530199 RepID=UPI001F0D7161|nr:hypothetical protein [Acidaminobacter sp. JC074]MCH4890540.1 hypothetical protein [Acidaminobacter sp. JC074]
MKDLGNIHQSTKRYYIEASIAHRENEDMKKAVRSLGIVLMFFENSLDNEFIIRDTRNFIYDLMKEQENKTGKKLLKGLLKIIK